MENDTITDTAIAPTSDENVKEEPQTLETTTDNVEATNNATKEEQETQVSAAVDTQEDGDRKKWDFTNRKVVVKNVLKFLHNKKQKDMVNSWVKGTAGKIKVIKFKKPPKGDWMVLTLESEDQVPILIDFINSNQLKNKKGGTLFAHRVSNGNGAGGADDQDDENDDGDASMNKNSNGDGENRKRGANQDDDKPFTKRQRQQRLQTEVANSKPRVVTDEEVKNAMIPLWRSSYDDQAKTKEREMVRKCAIKIVKEIKDKFRQIDKEAKRNKHRKPVKQFDWLKEKRAINVEPLLHAKSIVRNKCEFTFGFRYMEAEKADGTLKEDTPIKQEDSEPDTTTVLKKIPSVGAMTRGWSGSVSIPRCCRNIPSEAIAVIDIVEQFLAECPMPPYDSKLHRGFWRTLTVRSSRRTMQCMLIFIHAPLAGGEGSKDCDNIDSYPPEVFEREKSRLVALLTGKDLPVFDAKLEENDDSVGNEAKQKPDNFLRVTSIYFQEFDGISIPGPDHPVQHVYGEMALQEKLGKCTFQISPGAFFQVNTETAETLYNVVVEKVREIATTPKETLCFDVCCGTGTIGLTLLKEGVVGKVVGVDISAPAIQDAKINAKLNGFAPETGENGDGCTPTRFIAARAEHVMHDEVCNVRGDGKESGKVVAVVDPAREGLHADVLKALRGFDQIDRLVYVSCNPTGSLVQDAALLCTPASKRYKGRPFRPTFCQPVDMFPYSNHCEMVMVFDRMTEEEVGEADEE